MGMPAKKVKVVGQGGNGGKDDYTDREKALDGLGGAGVTQAQTEYQARMKTIADAEKLRKDKEAAYNTPDLTSDAVKASIASGYRTTQIARRSRANSFQTGASGFVNQGVADGMSSMKPMAVQVKPPTINAGGSMAGLTVSQKAKKAGF